MHSNVTSKNVSGFTLAGPPCMYNNDITEMADVDLMRFIIYSANTELMNIARKCKTTQ